MMAMLKIARNERLRELGWKMLLQVHDEVIIEGPIESRDEAMELLVRPCREPDPHPFHPPSALTMLRL